MPPPGYEPFLETILDNPSDDGPRLVYADWLEEQGDPRGEFIRVQLELERLAPRDPRWEWLADRMTALLNKHGEQWRGEVPEWARNGCEFRRGMIAEVQVFRPWLRSYGPELSRLAPVEKVILNEAAGVLAEYAAGPDLRHVTELAILDAKMEPNDLRVLTHSETALGPLKALLFMGMDLIDSGALMISLCPYLGGLQHLEMKRCAVAARGVQQLADSTNLGGLVSVDLSDNALGNDAFWYFIYSPLMVHLKRLRWNDNGLTNAAVRHLAEASNAANLTHLELAGNGLGDVSARLLRERFPHLEYLNLARNQLTTGMMLQLKEHYGERLRLGVSGE